jgi:ABC-type protease/lipase transport system fused ATPase/permease subunit
MGMKFPEYVMVEEAAWARKTLFRVAPGTELRPYFKRAAWLSVVASLLVLAPSAYMLEVYDRVVNSRSHMTLAMLTLLVLAVLW